MQKRVFLSPQNPGADVTRAADLAHGTRADAMWHARQGGRATRAHAGSLGGSSEHGRVAGATRVHVASDRAGR